MDKYEYKLKLEQLKSLVQEENYTMAAEIADKINWRKVKSAAVLCMVGEIYEKNKRYEDSREILLMAYDRAAVGRNILYRLTLVALKMGRVDEAKEYYEEFLEVAPYDNLKYVLRYQIAKLDGAPLEEQIQILEEYKEREYTEPWAFELAYLYHRAGNGQRCVEVCDELALWFGDGKYVEKALELKMHYQPLDRAQEEKYREIKMRREGVVEVRPTDMLESGEIIRETVQIPNIAANTGRFNTSNLQEELAKSMQEIMEAESRESVSNTMENVKKITEELPCLQMEEEEPIEEEPFGHIETDEEIDSYLKTEFNEFLAEEWDGQMSMRVPGGSAREPQVNGQMRIEDVLSGFERSQRAVEAAMENAEQRRLDSAKARGLAETAQVMRRLDEIRPKLDAGISPEELMAQRYLRNGWNDIDINAQTKENPGWREISQDLEKTKENPGWREISQEIGSLSSGGEAPGYQGEDTAGTGWPSDVEGPDLPRDDAGDSALLSEAAGNGQGGVAAGTGGSRTGMEGLDLPRDDAGDGAPRREAAGTGSGDGAEEARAAQADKGGMAKARAEDGGIGAQAGGSGMSGTGGEERASGARAGESVAAGTGGDEDWPFDAQGEDWPEGTSDEEWPRDEPAGDWPQEQERRAGRDRKGGEAIEDLIFRETSREMDDGGDKDAEQYLESAFRAANVSRKEKDSVPRVRMDPEEEPPMRLSPEQKEIFSYFVPVTGMEKQLCQVLEGVTQRKMGKRTSSSGNILITGGKGSGKTVLATDIIKALQEGGLEIPGKIGKISGESLNQKELSQLLDMLRGGCLIVEDAGQVSKETASALGLLMDQDTGGMLVVLEDTRMGMKKVLSQDVNFAKKFTERVKIPVFTSDELVEFAKAYAAEQECEIDDMAVLALYNRISNIQKLDEATTLAEVKDIVDDAIDSAEHGGLKKLFSRNKFSPEGNLYLREKDFEE